MDSRKWFLIGLFLTASCATLAGTSCNRTLDLSKVPAHLQKQLRDHPPGKGELTAYPDNTPTGGAVFGLTRKSDEIYAGTCNGLYRSLNAGRSWEYVDSVVGSERPSRLMDISNLATVGNTLFVQAGHSLYRSNDSGKVWRLPERPQVYGPHAIYDVISVGGSFLSANERSLFAIGFVRDALFRSNDLGSTWELLYRRRDGENVLSGASVGRKIFVSTTQGSYLSEDGGTSWHSMEGPLKEEHLPFMVNVDGVLLAGTDDNRIYSSDDEGSTWRVREGPSHEVILSATKLGDKLFVGTYNGIYVGPVSGGSWKEANIGLRSRPSPSLLEIDEKRFVTLYNSESNCWDPPVSQLFRSDDGGRTWKNVGNWTSSLFCLAKIDHSLLACTDEAIYRSRDYGETWWRITLPRSINPPSRTFRLISIENTLFAILGDHVFRTTEGWNSWEDMNDGLTGTKVSASVVIGEKLVIATDKGLFKIDKDGKRWESLGVNLVGEITALVHNRTSLIAATSTSDDQQILASLFLIDLDKSGASERLNADQLQGKPYALWSDADYPDVMIAGTSDGLFWSEDRGTRFKKWKPQTDMPSFREVYAIVGSSNGLFIGTDGGVYYVFDQIPRSAWYSDVWAFTKENLKVIGIVLAVLALFLFSTKILWWMLKFDIWPFTFIVPPFYLVKPGRWKLYRKYRATLKAEHDFTDVAKHYVDLPYTCSNDQACQAKLSMGIAQQVLKNRRIAVIAEGGRGKTALSSYLAIEALDRPLLFSSRPVVPVMIDGPAYSGNLCQTVTNTLSKYGAYVNPTIVETQLAAGNLLVIFDGFSEIRELYRESAEANIPEFITQHPDTRFIFTSRTALPPVVQNALGKVITFQLEDVNGETEAILLEQFLGSRSKADRLIKEIDLRFPTLPKIPLMLKLVATIYENTGVVPEDLQNLFEVYAKQLLRPAVTGIDGIEGLHLAIRHLVRKSHLESGGDRGLTEEKAVGVLGELKTTLENYAINESAIKLLRVLCRAGIYKRTGENMTFFHDSFESFYAAWALKRDFDNKEYDLIRKSYNNERLSETWGFFCKRLQPEDFEKVEAIVANTSENSS